MTRLCGPNAAYACTTGGYAGQSTGWWGAKYGAGYASSNAYGYHNCVLYAAYKIAQNGVGDPGWSDNANGWDTGAWNHGVHVDQSPAVGAIAQWNGGGFGHVAYVEVVGAGYIELTDDNYGSNVTNRWRINAGSAAWPDNFIHFHDLVSPPPPNPDTDGDGVPDASDPCPTQAGPVGGCPSRGRHASGASVSWASGRLDLFERTSDNRMVHKWWAGAGWSDWENHGGQVASNLDAVSWEPNRLDVFGRAANGRMVHKWWAGAGWSDWEYHDGQVTGDVSVVSWAPNRLDVFARAADGRLVHKWWAGAGWSDWEYHDGQITGDVSVVSWAPNRLDVFARAADGRLVHKWWAGAGWSDWEYHDGQIAGNITVASWAPNRLDVFARTGDARMVHKWWAGAGWSGWEDHAGSITGGLSVTAWAPGRLDVFARNSAGQLGHKWWEGSSWGGWEDQGGDLADENALVPAQGVAPQSQSNMTPVVVTRSKTKTKTSAPKRKLTHRRARALRKCKRISNKKKRARCVRKAKKQPR